METKETSASGLWEDADSVLNAIMVERQRFGQEDPRARTNLISQARALIAHSETSMGHIFRII